MNFAAISLNLKYQAKHLTDMQIYSNEECRQQSIYFYRQFFSLQVTCLLVISFREAPISVWAGTERAINFVTT